MPLKNIRLNIKHITNNSSIIKIKYIKFRKCISYLICYVHYNNICKLRNKTIYINSSCYVRYIETVEKYRNMKYATQILNHLIKFCKYHKIKNISLEDCSNNYNMPNNIYKNIGFKYICKNYPEMELNI